MSIVYSIKKVRFKMFGKSQVINFVLAFLGTVVVLIVGVTLFTLFWPA